MISADVVMDEQLRQRIASRLEQHRSQLAHLNACYREEMSKSCQQRSRPFMLFLSKELNVYGALTKELENLLA
jgi:hypothetical protein